MLITTLQLFGDCDEPVGMNHHLMDLYNTLSHIKLISDSLVK